MVCLPGEILVSFSDRFRLRDTSDGLFGSLGFVYKTPISQLDVFGSLLRVRPTV